ncbi:MAG: DegT/DnrJ/EryC1/StrS family aminotransferase, partial [Caldimonas sp.]
TTEDAERAERMRMQGVVRSGLDGMDVVEPGGKSNLSDVHAAIALGQLPHLATVTARRAALARAYFEAAERHRLSDLGIVLPLERADGEGVGNWHMFQVELPAERLTGGRAGVMGDLREAGIGTGVHYPALHLFSYYRSLGWRDGMLPHAERLGASILTLPLFATMNEGDVERVCAQLAASVRSRLA